MMSLAKRKRAERQRSITAPVTDLRGVGPHVAKRLHQRGITSIQDLLFHLPLRYQDRTRITPIGALRAGEETLIQGQIELTQVRLGRRRSLLSRLSDGTGAITLRFFHFSAAQQAGLAKGTYLRCYGPVRPGAQTIEMVHPEYQRIDPERIQPLEERLTPIYPTTEGLQQVTLRKLTSQALAFLVSDRPNGLKEWLPDELLAEQQLPRLEAALRYVHRPPPDAPTHELEEGIHPTQQRLAFEELLAHHLSLRRLRCELQTKEAPALCENGELQGQLLENLPFTLTRAQQRVVEEISKDMNRRIPMLRLLQGDVGSGKTVVVALAALQALEADYQVAMMVPTELLAEQHLSTFKRWLEPLGVEPLWLASKVRKADRSTMLTRLASADPVIAIGTHALFQADVQFAKLGLVIVDEQQRFGVHQRLALREKGARDGKYPHQLIMTATPIPRTLAMTAYADLDSSIIDEMPPNRQPVKSVVLPDSRREDVIQRIADACREGRQVYWVCTLIEESEVLQCQAATETAKRLGKLLPHVQIGLVHGRMQSDERERTMARFKMGNIDLLVATTVIEVGVDVPNASLMVIENPERLGLAQLHQLRGRIGRGTMQSDCVLMYQPPLTEHARARLAAIRETTNGFEIARRDLELRGPGELLGTKQTGLLQLRIADLVRDRKLLPEIQRAANCLLRDFPDHVEPLIQRWVGGALDYGSV